MKTILKCFIRLALLASLTSPMLAAVLTPLNFTETRVIPDNNASGVSFSFTVNDPNTSITGISVSLDLSGGFNGDLYAYLSHGDGFAVLLNRAGRTGVNELGYNNPGFAVTLSGNALNDIHLYQASSPSYNGNGQLTGQWAADGRDVTPTSAGSVYDSTPRNAPLSVFNGLNPNGEWSLFMADLSPGGLSTLNNLSVEITAVPEPQHAVLVCGLLLVGFVLYRQVRIRGS